MGAPTFVLYKKMKQLYIIIVLYEKMIEKYTKFIFQQYWYFNHLKNVGAFIGRPFFILNLHRIYGNAIYNMNSKNRIFEKEFIFFAGAQ